MAELQKELYSLVWPSSYNQENSETEVLSLPQSHTADTDHDENPSLPEK